MDFINSGWIQCPERVQDICALQLLVVIVACAQKKVYSVTDLGDEANYLCHFEIARSKKYNSRLDLEASKFLFD